MIERVDNNLCQLEDENRRHYLPHHPVITSGKVSKVRIIYNASVKVTEGVKSLNECMYIQGSYYFAKYMQRFHIQLCLIEKAIEIQE